ncbi:Glycolate dehydrogenase, iron-sulfur subunit GlcF [hydrothermal vent metagenome]|uniref:Glycolate dehydrogenase, iron-sulfur subunit GlcF n=1 Tax=hydrothermal vent metagenome TaxID=652676 RepID=A0A3B1DU74_9ZZZZ
MTVEYDKLLACIHCGLCTSACPTYLETGNENDSPRGRIHLMRAVIDNRIPLDNKVARHLDLCLDCRACETACPSGVQYGELIEPFRSDMHKQKEITTGGAVSGWFRALFLLGLFPYPARLRFALFPMRIMQWTRLDRVIDFFRIMKLFPQPIQRMYRMLPKQLSRSKRYFERYDAIGERRATVALFTGCVSSVISPQTNQATIDVLRHNGCDVIIPSKQTCCGAIHFHNGAEEKAGQFAKANVAAFPFNEVDAVITNVAGCGAMLKEYHQFPNFTKKVMDISEFLIQLKVIPPKKEVVAKVTYHDACHLCHAQSIRNQPRELLQMIPGIELVPLGESDICCGAAGSYNLSEPEMSDRLAARKKKHILKTEAKIVASANIGCTMQIDATLRHAGEEIQVLHPVELLAQSYAEECYVEESYKEVSSQS